MNNACLVALNFQCSVAILKKLSQNIFCNRTESLNSTIMDEAKNPNSASLTERESSWPFTFLVIVLVPVVAATMLYQLDSFDPAPLPPDVLTRQFITVPTRNDHMLRESEFVGVGNLIGPEDVAYDAKSGVIYTGCADGWISRVTVNDSVSDSVVEKLLNTGGRPLGIALGLNNELLVADPEKVIQNFKFDGTNQNCKL